MSSYKNPRLFLRTCNPDGTSYGGFQWPMEVGAVVSAPDWDPKPECGNGLHGLLDGQQDSDYIITRNVVWMVVEADMDLVVDRGGKCKFPECTIKAIGTSKETTDYLLCHGAAWTHFSTVTGDDGSTVTGGDGSTVTGGDDSTVTGGNRSTVTGGDGSILSLSWWDGSRKRVVIAYVGEDGIRPNTPYRLDASHQFAEATPRNQVTKEH